MVTRAQLAADMQRRVKESGFDPIEILKRLATDPKVPETDRNRAKAELLKYGVKVD
ncbi:hypothetical protein NIR10_004629 [Salmonella enterica]|nr:hypothetical protein [Salmonella enterica]